MKTPAKKNNKNPTTLYNYYFNSKSFSFLIIILSPEALSICEVINKNKGTDYHNQPQASILINKVSFYYDKY